MDYTNFPFYEELKSNLIGFLGRQKIVYTEDEVNQFLNNFLNTHMSWDNLKNDCSSKSTIHSNPPITVAITLFNLPNSLILSFVL